MERYFFDLDSIINKPKKHSWITILLGFVWLSSGIVDIYKEEMLDFFSYFYLIIGPLLIIIGIYRLKKEHSGGFYFEINDTGINYYLPANSKVKLQWNEIEEISILNLQIILITKNKKVELKLDEFPFKYVKETKGLIRQTAEEKGITIN